LSGAGGCFGVEAGGGLGRTDARGSLASTERVAIGRAR
jgi:hypothetical protein